MMDSELSGCGFEKRQKVLDLIHLFEQFPILWLKSHPEYKCIKKKQENWDKLLLKYKEQHPDEKYTTADEIKKHIRHLRQYFNREKKRVDIINQMTGATDKKESPAQSVYYFNEFKFLNRNYGISDETGGITEYDDNSEENIISYSKTRLFDTREKPANKDDSDVSFGSYVVAGLKEMDPEQNLLVKDFMTSLIRLGKTNQLSQNMSILLKPAETSFFIVEKSE